MTAIEIAAAFVVGFVIGRLSANPALLIIAEWLRDDWRARR